MIRLRGDRCGPNPGPNPTLDPLYPSLERLKVYTEMELWGVVHRIAAAGLRLLLPSQ